MTLRIGAGTTLTVGSGTTMTVPEIFDVRNLPGLVGWYDATDESTITESAGRISAWADKSGNGNDLSQGTGADQPYSGRTVGGLNAVDFQASEWLGRADALGVSGDAELTIFVLLEHDSVASSQRLLSIGPAVSGQQVSLGGENTVRFQNGNEVFPVGSVNTPYVITYRRPSGGNLISGILRQNREELASTGSSNPTNTISIVDSSFALGANANVATASFWNGAIVEVIVCNSELSDDHVNKVEAYLTQKYEAAAASDSSPAFLDGSFAHAVMRSNPARWYRNRVSGTNEPNMTMVENDATHDSASPGSEQDTTTPGPFYDIENISRDFDGTGGHETTADPVTELDSKTVASFGFWVRLGDTAADRAIMGAGIPGGGSETWMIWSNPASVVNNNGYTLLTGGTAPTVNYADTAEDSALQSEWQFVVFTMNGANRKGYIDGTLSAERNTATVTTIGAQIDDLFIGADGTGGRDLIGNLGDLIIWDRELSAEEVANLYLTACTPNLCEDPFDLSSGWLSAATITETGGVAGAPDGTSTVSTIEATAGAGAFNSSRHNLTSHQGNDRITFSAWVKENTQSTKITLLIYNSTDTVGRAFVDLDLTTGSITATGNANYVSSGAEDAGNGWYRLWVCGDLEADDGDDTVAAYIYPNDAGLVTAGDKVSVWNVQVTRGEGPRKVLDPRYFPRT